MKIKDLGQVFTPTNIVNDILNLSSYEGEKILNKHIIDNSCGDGAFLIEIVKRYINEYIKKKDSTKGLKQRLEKYIHGIEIDEEVYKKCIENLNAVVKEYNIKNVEWDILNKDALHVFKYNLKMDYVVGNPPYVRVHNLNEQYESVKNLSFNLKGMADLYIAFYEIGIEMLNKNGILCYITPNSFYNSIAGTKLRQYMKERMTLETLMDLGHYQPFSVNTYTTICKICNNKKFKTCNYYKYNIENGLPEFISNIDYKDLFVDDKIVLSQEEKKYFKYLNYEVKKEPLVQVKNAFATLNDKIFIQDEFEFDENTIDVIKASTGKWRKCIFPYDENGNILNFEELNPKVQKYLKQNKKDLTREKGKKDYDWYGFGRSQAIKDVVKDKICINTTIKDIESIKIHKVESGKGVYSGLYMLTDVPFDIIKEKICSNEFIEYLKVLNKCKSGGYYTLSSKDLAKYINCCLEEK